MPLRRLFAITSILFLAVLAISPVKNALRPYRSFQRQFAKLGATRAKSQKAAQAYLDRPVAIQQVWLPAFENRVDRCTTCHLGVQDPEMAGAPGPFRLHSRTAHTPGDFDRFGCTSCHGGQGPATLEAEAHGTAKDAGTPMRPLAYIESGCGRCHSAEKVSGAELLSRGRAILEKYACYACHAVRGHEAFRPEAPPLEAVGLKAGAESLRRWLRGPKAQDPNATMPDFHLAEDQVEGLSHYLFSLTPQGGIGTRIRAAAAEPQGDAVNGKKIFAESRCISCHTVEGKGNGSAPELSKVASRATPGWRPAHKNPRTCIRGFCFFCYDYP